MNKNPTNQELVIGRFTASLQVDEDKFGDPELTIELAHQPSSGTITLHRTELFDLPVLTVRLGEMVLERLAQQRLDVMLPDYCNLLELLVDRMADLRDPRVRIGNDRLGR